MTPTLHLRFIARPLMSANDLGIARTVMVLQQFWTQEEFSAQFSPEIPRKDWKLFGEWRAVEFVESE